MSKISKKAQTRLKIIGATATAIFSLASVFTGTYAWFASNNSVSATGMQISIKAPDSVEFEMYYLESFTDTSSNTKDGNYNTTTGFYSGYEVEYEDATFTEIDFEHPSNPSPLSIDHLWPAHKLTFAIVVTSGNASTFTLSDWSEGEGNEAADAAMTNANQYVRLSWAIDMYGKAYSVAKTNNIANDIASAFENSYYSDTKTDVFTYSETNLANVPPTAKDPIEVVGNLPSNSATNETIVFFTIEFSNSNSTFYSYNKTTGYYEKNTAGNSNCYENLSLNELKFEIK